jgi:hypothetical protein
MSDDDFQTLIAKLQQENATLLAALKTVADWCGPCECGGCVSCFAKEIVEAT